jgi:hypothetical protein
MGESISQTRVSALEALALLGVDTKARGQVRARVLVLEKGSGLTKRYTAHLRKGDGHLRYRWGRLVSATVYRIDGKISTVVFRHYEQVK